MSTPQNPYEPGNGSNDPHPDGQNPNNQPPNAPGYGSGQGGGQQPPQYGSQPPQYGSQPPQYGSQPNFGQNANAGSPGYGSQPPQHGQGSSGSYDPNQYGQSDYGQNPYDANAQYDPNQYDPNQYDPNQYAQQPAYAGAEGSSDQFIPANPNAAYGQFPPGTGNNTSKNIWGILALIGGIVGVLTSGLIIGGIFGAAAMVFGFMALSAIKKGLASNKGVSITGLVLGIAAVIFTIVAIVIYFFLGVGFLSAVGSAASSSSPSAGPTSGQQSPAQDPAQDPSEGTGGSDGGQAPPVQGGEVTIGTDLTAAVNVRPGTTTGIGAEQSNGEIAIVTMTLRNSSSSDIELTLADLTASDGGSKEYDDVFEGMKYRGSLAFADPIPAGGETTLEFGFGVPADEIDDMHLQLTLLEDLGNGKEFEFSKQ